MPTDDKVYKILNAVVVKLISESVDLESIGDTKSLLAAAKKREQISRTIKGVETTIARQRNKIMTT